MWGCALTCPWHNFRYDVRTGENVFPRDVYPKDLPDLQRELAPVTTYPVEIRDGEVWVDIE